MAEQVHEYTGKNVEDAIDEGLRQTGLLRSEVDIEIVSKGSRGIFGIGSEPARVRISPKSAPSPKLQPETDGQTGKKSVSQPPKRESTRPKEEAKAPSSIPSAEEPSLREQPSVAIHEPQSTAGADRIEDEVDSAASVADSAELETLSDEEEELTALAAELLGGMLSRMGFAEAEIVSSWQEDEEDSERYLLLDVQGDDLGILIGRRGETLASIQYLVRLMINQRLRRWKNVVVDIEQYKQRRVTQLTQLANRMAEQVVDSGRAVSLEPMPANERRIVHLALRDHPAVYTQSSGEGERRKVHIVARE